MPDPWIDIRPIPNPPSGTSRREAEGVAWRAIVRERLGENVAVAYNENGAPVLEKGLGYIGVSHTRGWVAVVWSPEPCAVDIELKTRNISTAAAARAGISSDLGSPATDDAGNTLPSIAAWCAWESGYKYRSVNGSETTLKRIRFHPHPELVIAVIT